MTDNSLRDQILHVQIRAGFPRGKLRPAKYALTGRILLSAEDIGLFVTTVSRGWVTVPY